MKIIQDIQKVIEYENSISYLSGKFIGIQDPPRWVVDKDWAMVAVSIVSVWKYMGYYMIVYLAALQGISSSLYEAASIDGANGWQKLWYITVPMLTPTTFFVLIMLTIQCFKVFDPGKLYL